MERRGLTVQEVGRLGEDRNTTGEGDGGAGVSSGDSV